MPQNWKHNQTLEVLDGCGYEVTATGAVREPVGGVASWLIEEAAADLLIGRR
jgi:hypothetical protein